MHRHPERISGNTLCTNLKFTQFFSGSNKITPTLEHSAAVQAEQGSSQNSSGSTGQTSQTTPKSPHIKRAKWHLGIRSQSRPGEMMEIFKLKNQFSRPRLAQTNHFLFNFFFRRYNVRSVPCHEIFGF
jgi:hypothetical protein